MFQKDIGGVPMIICIVNVNNYLYCNCLATSMGFIVCVAMFVILIILYIVLF